MSDQDAFQETPAQDPEQQAAPEANQETNPLDAFADQLASIKNADGTPKYTDVAQALDSIPHAQTHISTIENENATLKAELAKAQAAKELLEKSAGKTEPATQGLTPEEVAEVTRRTLAETEQANLRAANVAAVNAKFSELYGNKSSEQMQSVAADAGMSVDAVRALAEKSPQAVFKLAGITSTAPAPVRKTPGQGVGDNFQPRKQETPQPKSVMSGANTKQMIDGWRAAGEIISQ